MSVVDWVCKKISLESASERLSAITISRQQVRPSKLDACANVTTCCCRELGVLPKFQSKTFLKIHEYPRADDFEGKKRL